MKYIDLKKLNEKKNQIKSEYQSKKPFRFIMVENFFQLNQVELIYQNYPKIKDGKWDGTTYIDQKNKFQKNKFNENSIWNNVFKELNSTDFLEWLQYITEIEDTLIPDEELFGGGLHQSINGAYLNVHVDYNIHPKTKYHRRLNVIIYMNKNWIDEYEGHLELWDLSKNNKNLIVKFAPIFNRCVIFETNEISYHGHPKPLKTPPNINRKSIATYYYTKSRPTNEIVNNHNTIFVNTEGLIGQIKRLNSGFRAFLERIYKKF